MTKKMKLPGLAFRCGRGDLGASLLRAVRLNMRKAAANPCNFAVNERGAWHSINQMGILAETRAILESEEPRCAS